MVTVLLLLAALVLPVGAGKRSSSTAAAAKGATSSSGDAQDQAFYFFNEVTGELQWEDPGDVAFEDEAGVRYWLGPGGEQLSEEPNSHSYAWVEYYSEDLQRAYFYNQDTKETTWERPPDLAWRRVPLRPSAV